MLSSMRTLWLLLLVLLALLSRTYQLNNKSFKDDGVTPNIRILINTECSQGYFQWQTLQVIYAVQKAEQPGKITNLKACTKEQESGINDLERSMTEMFVHESYTNHPVNGDIYSAYNRPAGIIQWFNETEVEEDYILIIDPDMTIREPIYVEDYNISHGHAAANLYQYMKGGYNEMSLKHIPEVSQKNDSLAGPVGRRADTVGAFYLMTTEDLKKMAHLWLKYSEDVRLDEEAYKYSGDSYATKPGDRPWISEMYGYIYGAAKMDIRHIGLHDQMAYPGSEIYLRLPRVIHNGLVFTVPGTNYQYDKHWYSHFDVYQCPPWPQVGPNEKAKSGLFPNPPDPMTLNYTDPNRRNGQLLAIETVSVLNEALCRFYISNCEITNQLFEECNKVRDTALSLEKAHAELASKETTSQNCSDIDDRCQKWKQEGECDKNTGFMHNNCPVSCNTCDLKMIQTNSRPLLSGKRKVLFNLDGAQKKIKDATQKITGDDVKGIAMQKSQNNKTMGQTKNVNVLLKQQNQQELQDRQDKQNIIKKELMKKNDTIQGKEGDLRNKLANSKNDTAAISKEEVLKKKELDNLKLNTHDNEYALNDHIDQKAKNSSMNKGIGMDVGKAVQTCKEHTNFTADQMSECIKLAKEGKRYINLSQSKEEEDPNLSHQKKIQEELQKNMVQNNIAQNTTNNEDTLNRKIQVASHHQQSFLGPMFYLLFGGAAIGGIVYYRYKKRGSFKRKSVFRSD